MEILRRSFVETPNKMSPETHMNLAVLANNYGLFIDYVSLDRKIPSEKLRRNFGETSEEFRNKYGDKKAILLYLIAAKPSITATSASKYLGVSSRSVQTYLNALKESVIERVGPDKGGHWSIVLNNLTQ